MEYHYDASKQALIKIPDDGAMVIIKKSELIWRVMGGPYDDSYLRAIFLGQGCWEDLEVIEEEKAHRILEQWGYSLTDE